MNTNDIIFWLLFIVLVIITILLVDLMYKVAELKSKLDENTQRHDTIDEPPQA